MFDLFAVHLIIMSQCQFKPCPSSQKLQQYQQALFAMDALALQLDQQSAKLSAQSSKCSQLEHELIEVELQLLEGGCVIDPAMFDSEIIFSTIRELIGQTTKAKFVKELLAEQHGEKNLKRCVRQFVQFRKLGMTPFQETCCLWDFVCEVVRNQQKENRLFGDKFSLGKYFLEELCQDLHQKLVRSRLVEQFQVQLRAVDYTLLIQSGLSPSLRRPQSQLPTEESKQQDRDCETISKISWLSVASLSDSRSFPSRLRIVLAAIKKVGKEFKVDQAFIRNQIINRLSIYLLRAESEWPDYTVHNFVIISRVINKAFRNQTFGAKDPMAILNPICKKITPMAQLSLSYISESPSISLPCSLSPRLAVCSLECLQELLNNKCFGSSYKVARLQVFKMPDSYENDGRKYSASQIFFTAATPDLQTPSLTQQLFNIQPSYTHQQTAFIQLFKIAQPQLAQWKLTLHSTLQGKVTLKRVEINNFINLLAISNFFLKLACQQSDDSIKQISTLLEQLQHKAQRLKKESEFQQMEMRRGEKMGLGRLKRYKNEIRTNKVMTLKEKILAGGLYEMKLSVFYDKQSGMFWNLKPQDHHFQTIQTLEGFLEVMKKSLQHVNQQDTGAFNIQYNLYVERVIKHLHISEEDQNQLQDIVRDWLTHHLMHYEMVEVQELVDVSYQPAIPQPFILQQDIILKLARNHLAEIERATCHRQMMDGLLGLVNSQRQVAGITERASLLVADCQMELALMILNRLKASCISQRMHFLECFFDKRYRNGEQEQVLSLFKAVLSYTPK